VTELDKVTQQNSAAAEESSAAAVELTSQAGALDRSVSKLLKLVTGGSAAMLVKTEQKAKKAVPTYTMKPERSDKKMSAPAKPSFKTSSGNAIKNPVGAHASSEKANEVVSLKPSQIIPLDDGDFQGF
jgi:methyl-accepting chemotaxis protein